MIESDYGFYTLSIAARLAQGLGESALFIVTPSIIAQVYPEKMEVYIGYTQTLSALGYMLGPAIAAILQRWMDYVGIQVVFGSIVLLVGIFTLIVIPNEIDGTESKDEDESPINVPYTEFLTNTRSLMAFLMYFINAVGYCFYEPILSPRLQSLGLAEENVAVGFIILAASEAVGSIIVGFISERVDKRIVIFCSFILFSVAIYLTGGLATESLLVTLFGLGLTGFFQASGTVPIIPEVIEAMQEKYDCSDQLPEIN